MGTQNKWAYSHTPNKWNDVLSYYPVECCGLTANAVTKSICEEAQFNGGPDADSMSDTYESSNGCTWEARAMHTAVYNIFVSGQYSILIHGGVNNQGRALQDLWYIDMSTFGMSLDSFISITGGSADDPSWGGAEQTAIFADLKSILVQMVNQCGGNGNNISSASLSVYGVSAAASAFGGISAAKTSHFAFRILNSHSAVLQCVKCAFYTGGYCLQSGVYDAMAEWRRAVNSSLLNLQTNVFQTSELNCAPYANAFAGGYLAPEWEGRCFFQMPSVEMDVAFSRTRFLPMPSRRLLACLPNLCP